MDVVCEEKFSGGGDAAPGAADSPATKEGFGGQANEDLPDEDLLQEASCPCGLAHGRRLRALDPSDERSRRSCDGGGGRRSSSSAGGVVWV